jgi:hypothetical protein
MVVAAIRGGMAHARWLGLPLADEANGNPAMVVAIHGDGPKGEGMAMGVKCCSNRFERVLPAPVDGCKCRTCMEEIVEALARRVKELEEVASEMAAYCYTPSTYKDGEIKPTTIRCNFCFASGLSGGTVEHTVYCPVGKAEALRKEARDD